MLFVIAEFIKINFSKKILKNLPSVSNSLKPNKMLGLISVELFILFANLISIKTLPFLNCHFSHFKGQWVLTTFF